jgi:pyrroloquinoline quinone biosynthesis protein D
MTTAPAPRVAADPVIRLPRGVRLHQDRVRGVPVLLGPERVLMLDQTGHAILSEMGEGLHLSVLVDRLATRYNAPRDEISGDVHDFLDNLRVQRLVDFANA